MAAAPAESAARTLAALPVINIAPWLPGHDPRGRLSTAAALHAACLDFGFFYLDVRAFVDPDEPAHLATLARQFFGLPQGQKDAIGLRNQDGARGYQRLKENVTNGKADNHEAIDFYRPVDEPDKTRPLWGENQWPDEPAEFHARYEAWTEKMKALGMVVMEAMAAGLGMAPDEWEELKTQVDDSFWVMRVIGYPPLPNDHDGFSCGAHKDYGCLTFLYADDTRGALQVFLPASQTEPTVPVGGAGSNSGALPLTPNGLPNITSMPQEGLQSGVWIDADPIPGCVVCNIGEMWEIWTNGLYKATLHRVMHRSSNYRVSIPFFYEPAFNAHVKPLAAALRIQADAPPSPPSKTRSPVPDGATPPPLAVLPLHPLHAECRALEHAVKARNKKVYAPVVYGDFLLTKVGGNFALNGEKEEGKPRERY